MQVIDLRSDTLTHPTPEMRRAMANAAVGDDVFGEDPTVRELEDAAAECLGKEAALFVASGTMANLVSLMVHCQRGDEMLVGDQAHIFYYEQGGASAVAGIHPRILPNEPDGAIDPDTIAAAVRPDDVHFPRSRLLVLENTHNRCHGSPLDPVYMDKVRRVADRFNLAVHVDGARLFNAAAALNLPAAQLAVAADSVSICLSKGLAAPVGSCVCGSAAFIAEARRARKVLGGGMRQSGILAAAGLVALTGMTGRLVQDHDNAKALALCLNQVDGLRVDTDRVRTNIVYIRIIRPDITADQLCLRLYALGVRVLPMGKDTLRAVTHYQISRADVTAAVAVFTAALSRP